MRSNCSRDVHGLWINRIVRNWELLAAWVYTLLTRCYAGFFGISLGSGCRFLGVPVFRRAENSRIEIGNACTFRSVARWTGQVGIMRPCTIQTLRQGALVKLGQKCGLSGAVIAAAEKIVLGDRVLCGANVTITDTDWHHTDPGMRTAPDAPSRPVHISDNVWLGANVIVLKGVTIGENSVVAAGSVVTKDVPPNVVAAGQPARPVRACCV